MSIDTEVNDFFGGGGSPYAKFLTPGTTVKGTVVKAIRSQQTKFEDGSKLFWDDGKPRMQVVITLATDERDPDIDGDKGYRDVYVKGQMQAAVGMALKEAKAELEVGGTLAVRYTGDGEPRRAGLNAPKQYVAQYKPPVAQPGGDLLDDPTTYATASAAPAPQDLI